jgi:hypothetical protein
MFEVTNGVFRPEDLTDYQAVLDKTPDSVEKSRRMSQEE